MESNCGSNVEGDNNLKGGFLDSDSNLLENLQPDAIPPVCKAQSEHTASIGKHVKVSDHDYLEYASSDCHMNLKKKGAYNERCSEVEDCPGSMNTQDTSGVSFVRAVQAKYKDVDDTSTETHDVVFIHVSAGIKTTPSGTMNLPKHVSMSGQEISIAGDPVSIHKMCSKVTLLDLMENNITCWYQVFNIIECIPHLTFLNLTSNSMTTDFPHLTSLQSRSLPCLTHLVLNNTGVTWKTVESLLVLFPSLIELHLGKNNFHDFGLPVSSLSQSHLPSSSGQKQEQTPHIITSSSGSNPQHLAEKLSEAEEEKSPTLAKTALCDASMTITSEGDDEYSSTNAAVPSTTAKSNSAFTSVATSITAEVQQHITSTSLPNLTSTLSSVNANTIAPSSPSVPKLSAVNASAVITTPPSTQLPFTSVTSPAPHSLANYPNLQRLFFMGNPVTEWQEICKLGAYFSNLEYLLLAETGVSSLGDPDSIPKFFPCLKTLVLAGTRLDSWEEVEKLSSFPALTDVRLSGVPFLEKLPTDLRFLHTVALLPNICTLNGSRIGDVEREDAERAFLRLYMDTEVKPFRRYQALEQKYGKLDPLAKVDLKPQRKVKLKVRVEDAQENIVFQEDMQFELDQTVKALRKTLCNVAGKPASKITLFYLNQLDNHGAERLIYVERKLHSIGMVDGDQIIVAVRD